MTSSHAQKILSFCHFARVQDKQNSYSKLTYFSSRAIKCVQWARPVIISLICIAMFMPVKKAEHLYSALHGIQTTLKRSGMDHTAFNLQRTPCQPLPHKRSPDGASTKCGGGHLIGAHYSFIDPRG